MYPTASILALQRINLDIVCFLGCVHQYLNDRKNLAFKKSIQWDIFPNAIISPFFLSPGQHINIPNSYFISRLY
jgi:hypothetical protein